MAEMPPDQRPESERAGGRAGVIVQFVAALVATLGVGSLVNWLAARARRKESRQAEQRRAEQAAERAAEIARLRALGHEPDDLRLRPIVGVLIAAGVVALLLSGALFGLLSFLSAREQQADRPISPLASPQLPPEPRLQVDPAADWQRLRATDEALLSSYGWADRPGGAVRIPIDRAMDLLAQRGLPARSGGQPDTAYDQAHNLDSMGGQAALPTPAPLGQPGSPPAVQPTATATPSAATAPQPTGAPTPTGAAGAQGGGL